MDTNQAEEIVASDYAHNDASDDLPEAAWVLLQELQRVRAEVTTHPAAVEWAVQYRDEAVANFGQAEQAARFYVATPPVEGYQLVRREVRTSGWVPVPLEEGGPS